MYVATGKPLEKEMATHSSVLAWKTPWTGEPGGLQSMGSQGVRHDWMANTTEKPMYMYIWTSLWLSGKKSAWQCRRHGFDPWVEKIPWRRKWQPTVVSLTEKFRGQRSPVGYSPWGRRRAGHNLVMKRQYTYTHTHTTYNWIALLYSWNLRYIENQLYFNYKIKLKNKVWVWLKVLRRAKIEIEEDKGTLDGTQALRRWGSGF